MGNIAQIICQPTVRNDRKIKKICDPLEKGLGLDTFWYYSISEKGELSYVCNDPNCAEYFYSNELYLGHPYFKTPALLQSGFFFADNTTSPDYISTQGKMRGQISMDQTFMIMNIEGQKAEGYGFATKRPHPSFANMIINNLYLLRKFIGYFHEETKEISKQLRQYTVDIGAECESSFHTPTPYFPSLSSASTAKNFFNQIDPMLFQRLHSLSKREKECLKWFLKGMSAIQIGKKMFLSNRTIEKHIDSIKGKLGCNTKQELFDILLNSNDFLPLTFF